MNETGTLFNYPKTRDEIVNEAAAEYLRLPLSMAVQTTPADFIDARLRRHGYRLADEDLELLKVYRTRNDRRVAKALEGGRGLV